MSRAEPEPDLEQTHGSFVQLIMQGCRQLWQTEDEGKRRGDGMKEAERNEWREDRDGVSDTFRERR